LNARQSQASIRLRLRAPLPTELYIVARRSGLKFCFRDDIGASKVPAAKDVGTWELSVSYPMFAKLTAFLKIAAFRIFEYL
jgi:hypothetical protein